MVTEIWAGLPSAPGYCVSNTGRVIGPRGPLSTPKTGGGYFTCSLKIGGKKITTTVQRLVLEAFVGPPPTPQHEANHKDGNKTNNCPSNLEWVTRQENMDHARDVLGVVAGRPRKPRQRDLRQPFDLLLCNAGWRDLRIEPRLGYVSWQARDMHTGDVIHCAALKELLHRIADELPRMMAARNYQ